MFMMKIGCENMLLKLEIKESQMTQDWMRTLGCDCNSAKYDENEQCFIEYTKSLALRLNQLLLELGIENLQKTQNEIGLS